MMNTSHIHHLAIAAVSLVAVTGCAGANPPSPDTVSANAGGLPRPLGAGHQPLSAGVHVLDLGSREPPGTGPAQIRRIAITLPAGWFNYDGWAVNDGGERNVGFWSVDKVYSTPCRWQGKPMIDPGRSVDGLASTLASRPLRHASKPTAVTLAGFHGKYLSWSVPAHIDTERCDQGFFESWTAAGWSRDRWQQGPGQVDRIWILDVHGQRLVVDAGYMPGTTGAARAQLDRIVRSIRILRPIEPTGASAARHTIRNGQWIAYSTAAAGDQRHPYGRTGSDVFLTSAGGRPKLVAGRGHGAIWNLCPAFSPDGKKLAFGRKAPDGRAIVVVSVARDGTTGAPTVLSVPGPWAPCPKWSSDGSRVAYVDRKGAIAVRGLDGSMPHWAAGDPTIDEFDRRPRVVLSPTGKLVVRRPYAGAAISRPDGSHRQIIDIRSYAVAGWSPDGRELLLMTDVGDGFMMRAVSARAPFPSTRIVGYVPVNNDRSWPGYGDVSWQPIPPR